MKNKFSILLIVFFTFIFIIFYKGLNNSNIYVPSTQVEKDVPDLKVKLLRSQNEIELKSLLQGNEFYLINIWSSWCGPCREEHPILMNLKNQKNINIIGLNYKDNKANAEIFLRELGNPYYEILEDNNGSKSIELGAYGVPESFLIHQNKIIRKYIGPLNQNLFTEINSLIK
ncbi:MAG: cytochrome C biogenesis protein [Pelagibacteraceae bacterium BACL5 MAG-121015-bin10]|jgi:cytochrome c biogenesis protein CcmG, thiol:disulfide interchange protein DsbE|nr:MAG: cytochrome C biogenesis protein [Pelagibacteraceae bacterium BACL5 MAG-121015-bin10]